MVVVVDVLVVDVDDVEVVVTRPDVVLDGVVVSLVLVVELVVVVPENRPPSDVFAAESR